MRRTVKLKETIAFAVTTVLLVAISVFFVAGTVVSQSNIGELEMENYYREQEKKLLCQMKEQLEELGYSNSGVTLTRVVDEEGNREYTFTIHHGKIDRMSEAERVTLAKQLKVETSFTENCSFFHEFLMYD